MGCNFVLKWCGRFAIALDLHGNVQPQVTGKDSPRLFLKEDSMFLCWSELFDACSLLGSFWMNTVFRTCAKHPFKRVFAVLHPVLVSLLFASLSSLLGVSDSVCMYWLMVGSVSFSLVAGKIAACTDCFKETFYSEVYAVHPGSSTRSFICYPVHEDNRHLCYRFIFNSSNLTDIPHWYNT